MGLGDGLLCVVFFNLIGACFPAWFATFGVKTGLRQMVITRYWWGFWGGKIVAILNLIACVSLHLFGSIIYKTHLLLGRMVYC